MRLADFIGNIFLLDKEINKKQIVLILLAVIIIPFFKLLLENEIIVPIISIKESFYALSAISLFLIFKNIKILIYSFKRFFVFNWSLFIRTIVEILLSISIVYISILYIPNGMRYGIIIGLFWLFSGLLKVLLNSSEAIFLLDIEDYLNILQIFAYSRTSYYGIVIIVFYDFITISTLFELLYMLPLFVFGLYFIANLNPYMKKHTNVKNTLELIRIVKNEKKIKVNNLKKLTNFSYNNYDKMIVRLASINFLEINNKRIELGKNLKF